MKSGKEPSVKRVKHVKPQHERVVRLNICLRPDVLQRGKKVLAAHNFYGWSHFVSEQVKKMEQVAA